MVNALSCHSLFDSCRVGLRRDTKTTEQENFLSAKRKKQICRCQNLREDAVRFESPLLYCKTHLTHTSGCLSKSCESVSQTYCRLYLHGLYVCITYSAFFAYFMNTRRLLNLYCGGIYITYNSVPHSNLGLFHTLLCKNNYTALNTNRFRICTDSFTVYCFSKFPQVSIIRSLHTLAAPCNK